MNSSVSSVYVLISAGYVLFSFISYSFSAAFSEQGILSAASDIYAVSATHTGPPKPSHNPQIVHYRNYANHDFGITRLQFPNSWIITRELDERSYADFSIINMTSRVFDLVLQPAGMNLSMLQNNNSSLIYNSSGQLVSPFLNNTGSWVELSVWRSYMPSIANYSDTDILRQYLLNQLSVLRQFPEININQLQPISLSGIPGYKLVYSLPNSISLSESSSTENPKPANFPTKDQTAPKPTNFPQKDNLSSEVSKDAINNTTKPTPKEPTMPTSSKVITDFYAARGPFIYSVTFGTNLEKYQANLADLEQIIKSIKINTPPTAIEQSTNTTINKPVEIKLTVIDPDVGDQVTYSKVIDPVNGTLSQIDPASGKVTYTPNKDYIGDDSFTFKANDGKADSNTATVNIKVNGNAGLVK
jgi:hypothetical protein